MPYRTPSPPARRADLTASEWAIAVFAALVLVWSLVGLAWLLWGWAQEK